MLKAGRATNYGTRTNAFTYQFVAVQAIQDKEYAAVFHEQGLGKTKIAIDLALFWLSNDIVDSVLIVTKRGLVANWSNEIKVHSFVNARVLSQDRNKNYYSLNSPARIYLAHYEVLASEKKRFSLFLKTRRVGVILDEAHKIKNPKAGISTVLHELAPLFVRRIIMTGTPVANRPYDLWSQIYFLDRGASLGTSFTTFKADLELSNDLLEDLKKRSAFEKALSSVYDRISAFSVRETKLSAGIQLPDKVIRNIFVDLEHRQQEIYDAYRHDLGMSILRDGRPEYDSAEDVLKRLLRLVQIASNPRIVDSGYKRDPGKVVFTEEILNAARDNGEKVIVWTSFIENADWLARRFDDFGTTKVHGRLDYSTRERNLTSFKDDESIRVLVATPGAAKEGLTLTRANHAIFFDRSFSLDDYLQAQDRIHRISQKKECYVYNLIARWSIDEWVDQLLSAKQMAAQLAQGDISAAEFNRDISYSFSQMLQEVLGGTR